jgi:Tol biopolymer transport system component
MPDGRTVVHLRNRGGATNIWSMPIDGGLPARLTSGSGPDESPTVDAHGRVPINSRWRNELLVYGPNGGMARSLASRPGFLWSPAFSPDGQDLAFSRGEVDGFGKSGWPTTRPAPQSS